MTKELRLRRLDALFSLLARAQTEQPEQRLEDALDALLDATPATAAAAFDRDTDSGPSAQRRLPQAFELRSSALIPALSALAERCLSTSSVVQLSDIRHDQAGIEGTDEFTRLGAQTALAVPIASERALEGALVLLFANSAMLDEETLAYIHGVARMTALSLSRDRSSENEARFREEWGEFGDVATLRAPAGTLVAPLAARSRRDFRASDLRLAELVREAITLTQPQLERRGVLLVEELDPECATHGRRDHLTRVIVHLLLNAADAAQVSAPPRIWLRLVAEPSQLLLSVEDNGPGGGACFRLHLPRADRTASPRSGERPQDDTPAPPAERQRVLLIDDDPVLARGLQLALKAHDVRIAGSASEAEIALLDPGYEPDLVVCDVLLPGANGDTVHLRVSERRPELARRFVFVTGGGLAKAEADYIRASGLLTLLKPLDVQTLLDLLRRPRDALAGVRTLTHSQAPEASLDRR